MAVRIAGYLQNEIVGLSPGELFVHRNVANIIVHTDFNCLSVLQFAVEVLKVKHIIVCGHYGCGGVAAALNNQKLGLIDNWLSNIKDIYQHHEEKFKPFKTEVERIDFLCELNVVEQLKNVATQQLFKTPGIEDKNLQFMDGYTVLTMGY